MGKKSKSDFESSPKRRRPTQNTNRKNTTSSSDGEFTNDASGKVLPNGPTRHKQCERQRRIRLFRGTNRSNVQNDSDVSDTVFPVRSEWLVFIITLIVRLNYVSQKKNWWVLHPDEVFQIIEVAHSEVYGYGFRPYEYLPPPTGNFSSTSAQFEAQLGMYGLRSFILPKIFMLVFTMADLIGFTDQPFLAGKFFHATIASILPLSVYKLATVLYTSHDIGVMAAIFTGFSLQLTLFGTHVLVNSFLAPVVFWCLTLVIQDFNSSFTLDYSSTGSPDNPETDRKKNCDDIFNNNSKIVIVGKLQRQLSAKQNDGPLCGKLTISGFVLGVCCYIRNDLVLFIGVFLAPFLLMNFQLSLKYLLRLLQVGGSFLIGGCVAGLDDLISYGQWGLSATQWIRFNLFSNLSATLFGESVGTKYVYDIFFCNVFISVMSVAVFFGMFLHHFSHTPNTDRGKRTDVALVLICTTLLIFYSIQPHKETRFVHNVIALVSIIKASVVIWVVENRGRYWADWKFTKHVLYAGVISIYIMSSWTFFPNTTDSSISRWSFSRDKASLDVNVCMSYISSREDVTGVFNGQSMQDSGAFSLLHKDVTFLSLVRHEVCEYSPTARISMPALNPFSRRQYNVSVNLANKVSDYIASSNIAYVYKLIIEDSTYNYAIVPKEVDFGFLGFTDVFVSYANKVIKRSKSPKLNQAAREFAKTLPVWTNATELEYEGRWLVTLGVPVKAIPRLKRALDLDQSRVMPYQLLMAAYDSTGQHGLAVAVQNDCIKHHSTNLCFPRQS